MFSSLKQKAILGIYIFLILSIPVGAYLASEANNTSLKTSAQDDRSLVETTPVTAPISPIEELKNELNKLNEESVKESSPSSLPSSGVSFGPTLNLKLILEGRPANKQAAKVFIGIAAGSPTGSPKYILSFTIDLPDNGSFSGLSLAGLTENSQYTAYLKGPAQIATSSAFIMSPSVTTLNSSGALTLLTGDLNEDNTVNSADYSIAKGAFGTTPTSSKWNANIDFNKDDLINNLDLGYITKNFGKVGAGGVWTSTPPSITTASVGSATDSATPSGHSTLRDEPSGSDSKSSPSGGYWIWVPSF